MLMVSLMISGMPVLSLVISDVTRLDGVFVGNGPAVSVGEVVQVPLSFVVDPPSPATSSFLHELTSGMTKAAPRVAIPFLKNDFLSIQ